MISEQYVNGYKYLVLFIFQQQQKLKFSYLIQLKSIAAT